MLESASPVDRETRLLARRIHPKYTPNFLPMIGNLSFYSDNMHDDAGHNPIAQCLL